MAKKKKRGLIDRLIMGTEKSEGYARAQLPSNRWELGWDIFKGSFGKLFLINLLVLLFVLPLIFLLFFRLMIISSYGMNYPFSQGFGAGFQAPVTMAGYSQNIIFMGNLIGYLGLPIASIFAAIGVAGGAYVVRNLVWTEGIFVANDFWRGIKQNFKQIALIGMLFSVVFYLVMVSVSLADQYIALGSGASWILVASKIVAYVLLAFFAIVSLHMITLSVTYKLKFRHLFKNAVVYTVGMLPQNVFFIALAGIPFVILMIGGMLQGIGIILLLILGFSFFLLVWTNYAQWGYDKFLNDKIPGAQKNRGIYQKVKESDSKALQQYRAQIAMAGRSALSSRPIKPITDDELKIAELPTSFNREDLLKLGESKQAIYEDHARYVEEHKDDPKYQKTEEDIAFEESKKERDKRIAAAKRELMKRDKKKK